MKINRFTAVSLIAAALIAFAGCKSEEKLALKFSPKKGKKFEITMETKQTMEMGGMGSMTQDIVFEYDMEVKEKDAKNNSVILTTFRHIKLSSKSGMMDIDYDSDKPSTDSNMMSAMFSKIFSAMLNKTVTLVVDEKGKAVSLKGMDAIISGMMDSSGVGGENNAMLGTLKTQYSDENFLKNFDGMFSMLPGKDVSVGDTWQDAKTMDMMNMKMKTDSKYVLKDIKDKTVILSVASVISMESTPGSDAAEMTMEGTQTGTVEVDKESGLPLSLNLEQDITMATKSGGTEVPMKMKSIIKMTSKELK